MLWSKLITKKLSCPKKAGGEKEGEEMTCTMDMESYGYTAEDVSYELKDGDKSFGAGQQEKFETCRRISYIVKKAFRFSRPQPGCHLPNSAWPGINKIFPARDSLVSDLSAGDGKIINLFLLCISRTFSVLTIELRCTL
jgi:hypothetical protein